MAKEQALHTLLAIESGVTTSYNRDKEDTQKKFGRGDIYTRKVTKKEYFAAEDQRLNTSETLELTSTVGAHLDWFSKSAGNLLDLILKKDKTNQVAKADLVVNGVTLAKDVPATTLLAFESKLQEFRKVFEVIPTLPSGTAWDYDVNEGLYKNREPKVTFSTKKTAKAVVLYEATQHHPAQVKEINEDVHVASITVDTYLGMIPSVEKATILERLDILLQACKKARQEANSTTVVDGSVGSAIFDYLYKDVVRRT